MLHDGEDENWGRGEGTPIIPTDKRKLGIELNTQSLSEKGSDPLVLERVGTGEGQTPFRIDSQIVAIGTGRTRVRS